MTSDITERPGRIQAPWTEEQVAALAAYQRDGRFHAYTCGNGSSHGGGALTPTVDGWVCPDCSYRQRWAHTPIPG